LSHLHVPRICIHGTFVAEGVTANNVLAALDDVNTRRFKPPADRNWHNNNCASNRFWLIGSTTKVVRVANRPGDCSASCDYSTFLPSDDDVAKVVSALDSDGPAASDPVLGSLLAGAGVMADLDPEHRRVTDLVGLKLRLGTAAEPFLKGTLRPTQLRDFWVAFVDGDWFGVSTIWQSVLDVQTWAAGSIGSKVLRQLHALSPKELSVRLVMTHYNASPTSDRRNTGKFLAVIGPHDPAEPEQIAAWRRLTSPGNPAPKRAFPAGAFLVDPRRKKLVVDLGNLVPWALVPDRGLLTGLTAAAGGTALSSPPRDLTVGDWLTSGGVVEWDLTASEEALLADRPLRLTYSQASSPGTKSLEEHPEGKYIDVDRRSLRLNPGQTATVALRAWKFGNPLEGAFPFYLLSQRATDPIASLGIGPGDPYYPDSPNDLINSQPADVFAEAAPPFSVSTDSQGRGELRLSVKPGPFPFPALRKSINSQLYFLGDPDGWQSCGALGPPVGAGCALSVLVFNSRPSCHAPPTWDDVGPILARYARLYPFMNDYESVDLGDREAVRINAEQIKESLLYDVNDARYMPVTRDLSRDDRLLILAYLASLTPGSQTGKQGS
jgi:hypothetical protein